MSDQLRSEAPEVEQLGPAGGGAHKPFGWQALRQSMRRVARSNTEVLFPLGVLVVLFVTLSILSPHFFTQENLSNLLGEASVLAIIAFGVTIVILAGHFDLSVGAGVALVGTVAGMVMVNTDSTLLGIAAGIGTGLALGAVNGVLVAYLLIPSFIATLAMLVIARGLSLTITDGRAVTGLPAGFTDFVSSSFLGITVATWIAAVVLLVLFVVLHRTRLGVEILAVGGNAEAARLSGLSVRWVQAAAFLISGAAVSIAGLVLTGRLATAQPNAAQLTELWSVAAVVLGGTSLYGGRGSVLWTVVGVLLIAVIQNGLTLENVNADTQNIVLGTVFIAAALSGVIRRRTS